MLKKNVIKTRKTKKGGIMPTESKGKLDRLNTATWEFQTNWKKWREAKFPPESKLHNAEEVEKRKIVQNTP